MQNIKEVEIPIQKVVSDTPAGLSELLNLRHDGEDITSLFSELGSKELFQTKGKCYGAIIHADKCYAIHKSDSSAVLVCYMNIDGEVKEVSSTPMSYNSNDLAQMFIVRNELLYLDGREYKQVELPQYTLDGQTTSTNEQKEDFVGCDKLDVFTSGGGGFAHPVKYFVRRRFKNGSVSQVTGSSLVCVPVSNNSPLKIGEVSSHGFKISVTSQISGVVMIYRVYAGSTSLIAMIDVTANNVVEFNDESPSLGQAIADEGITDSPIVNINGSAVSFWNDRAIIASLSGENEESSISTNIDVSGFNIEDRATIEWKESNSNINLIEKYKFGTFVYGETYHFLARIYYRNRIETVDLGTKYCDNKSTNNIVCHITLKSEFASFLESNDALRVDYGYNSENSIKNIGLSVMTVWNNGSNDKNIQKTRIPFIPFEYASETVGESIGLSYDAKIHTFTVAQGDSFRADGEYDVFLRKVLPYSSSIEIDRTIGGISKRAISHSGIKEGDNKANTSYMHDFNKVAYIDLGYAKHLNWVYFYNTGRVFHDKTATSYRNYATSEVFAMHLPPMIGKCSLIDKPVNNSLYYKFKYRFSSQISSPRKVYINNTPAQSSLIALKKSSNVFCNLFDDVVYSPARTTYIYVSGDGFKELSIANYIIAFNTDEYKQSNSKSDYIKFSFVLNSDETWFSNYDWATKLMSDLDIKWNNTYSNLVGSLGDFFGANYVDGLFDGMNNYNLTVNGFDCNVIEYDEDTNPCLAYIKSNGSPSNNFKICSSVYGLHDTATLYCNDYYNTENVYLISRDDTDSNSKAYENIATTAFIAKAPSKIPSIYRCDSTLRTDGALSSYMFEMNPLYLEEISDNVFLDIESKSFVDKSINDIKIYWSLPTSNKTYKPWLSFYQESFKTLDRLGEVLKMFPFGNCLLCVCTDGIQAVFAPPHSMTGENGESIALTNAEFAPSVRTITKQPLTNNPDNVIFANDYVYILSEKQGELIGVSPNLEVKHIASVENCKLLVDSIASANKFRSNDKYSFLSYHYDKNELLLCNQDRSVSYGKFGFEITSYYNTGVGIFVSGTQCIANDDNIMYKLRCDSNCKKILDKQEDIAISITLNTPYNQGLVVDGLTLDTSYITHTLFDESTAKHRNYRMISGRNGMNQDNPWQNITIANAYSSTNLPLLEKGDGRHTLYAASRFLESILRITMPRVKEVAENTMRLHGNRLYIKLHSRPKTRVILKAISMLIHAFKR